jgi:LmbE family N-acetylglucosaminyl deacetylase
MSPERVLVVVAHPDDPEFLFGGTIARLVADGADVRYLVCSDGRLGADDPSLPTAGLVATRRAEQHAAAAVLGVREVRWLGLPDGELAPTLDLRAAIAREIERFGPDLVITHYPRRALAIAIEASHPDHVAVGETALSAAWGAGSELWVAGYEAADHAVDVSDFVERKERALLCHASQLGGGGVPEWTRHEMAAAGGRAGCRYAEEFVRQPPMAVGWRGW